MRTSLMTVALIGLVNGNPLAKTKLSRAIVNDTQILDGHYLPANITSRTFFNGTCTADNLVVRKEWRSLTHDEKLAFVDAEKCMMALPNKTSNPGALDRFSDFQAAHQQGTNTTYGDVIHYTVSFSKSQVTTNE